MQDYKICVYAICKNESKFIDVWLENMSEADYIVVLDTGSTDGSFERLQADKRVTHVEQAIITPWRFDVARNESMKLIPTDADILVCTDFDELFNKGWADVLRQVWQPDTTRVFYSYAWSHTENGTPTDVFLYDKIHTRDYQWVFPVHEVLLPVSPTFEQKAINVGEQIYLHHYQDKAKARDYFELLQLSTKENPEDSHVRMLLAREYIIRGELENALKEYLEVLQMPDVEEPNKRLVLLESIGRVASIYQQLGNYEEALWYCREFIKENSTYKEPYFMMAEIYNNMKLYTLAKATAEAGLKYTTRKYDWIERADVWTYAYDDIMGVADFYLGNYEEAVEHGKKALEYYPDDPRLLKNYTSYLTALVNKLNTKLADDNK